MKNIGKIKEQDPLDLKEEYISQELNILCKQSKMLEEIFKEDS